MPVEKIKECTFRLVKQSKSKANKQFSIKNFRIWQLTPEKPNAQTHRNSPAMFCQVPPFKQL